MRRASVVIALVATLNLLTATATSGQQVTSSGGWQPGPGATGDNTYSGVIDSPSNGATVPQTGSIQVTGWFVDTTAQGWAGADDVQVFLGTMDSGKLLGHGNVGLTRPDVGAALGNPFWSTAGWQAAIDATSLAPGQNTLSVYLHTAVKGWWSLPLSVSAAAVVVPATGELLAPAPAAQGRPPLLTVLTPKDAEYVSTSARNYLITGTATDRVNGARGIDWVEVWLNGETNSDRGIFLGVADMSADGTWSIGMDAAQYPPLNSNVYAYAHSAITGKTTVVVVHFYITDRVPGR